ncbi:hypothetical protein [Mycolicibacterium vinylchloridicum]|uniref:hypothetical protein n=1 Tax=Mycolicibacterium vinylchloridicum TaxID=2736928 RepID=UPI0015C7D56F|nr:hypothetical protein [Mycolicibacterium vinylchloridicum]
MLMRFNPPPLAEHLSSAPAAKREGLAIADNCRWLVIYPQEARKPTFTATEVSAVV